MTHLQVAVKLTEAHAIGGLLCVVELAEQAPCPLPCQHQNGCSAGLPGLALQATGSEAGCYQNVQEPAPQQTTSCTEDSKSMASNKAALYFGLTIKYCELNHSLCTDSGRLATPLSRLLGHPHRL